MSLLFVVLKAIVKVSLRIFYSKTTFKNRERGFFKNPCIVVSNHPSTVMDPLNTVAWIGPQVRFLANASLFKTPLSNWFFNTFYCIKVERYQDTGGKPLNNEKAFERAREYLTKGGCIFVAPEGGSYPDRKLRPLKTGCARIALDAAKANNFELGLTILPVGLNYGNPRYFRTTLFTNFGTHIYVKDFQNDFEENPREAVRKLTSLLSERFCELILCTKNKEEELLLRDLEVIFRNEKSLTASEDFERSQLLIKKIRYLEDSDESGVANIRSKVISYFEILKKKNLSDEVVKQCKVKLTEILILVFGFPLFLIGCLFNFFPTFIPGQINKRFNNDESYYSTYKYVSGLVFFPLFYWFQINLVEWIWQIDFNAMVYILAFILTGYFAEWYMKIGKLFFEKLQWRSLEDKEKIKNRRKEILEIIDFELPIQ